jgi:hypothetical protein
MLYLVRSGYIMLGQVRSGYLKVEHLRPFQARLVQVGSGLFRLRFVMTRFVR